MIYAGRKIKKPKFKIGDLVQVKELKSYVGKISFPEYRFEGHVGWHYKITFPHGQLTFSEKSLKRVRIKKPLHQKV